MNDIVIPEITITHWELPAAFFVMFVILLVVLAVSNNWESLPRKRDRVFGWLSRNYVWIMIVFGFTAIVLALTNWLLAILPQVGNILDMLANKTDTDSPGKSEDIKNLSYAVAVLLGAIAFAATVPFQLIRTYINERLANTTEQGHMTDRITKAVEQLAAEKTVWDGTSQYSKPNVEVRLGGIYALERIAKDSLRDHITVMEIFCAYVRENSPAISAEFFPEGSKLYSEEWNNWAQSIDPLRIDLQSILDVIGRRNSAQLAKENDHGYRLDLRSCNLQRADFDRGNFCNAVMDKSYFDLTRFYWTKLNGAEFYWADLHGATFYKAELSGAELVRANLYGSSMDAAQTQLAGVMNTNLSEIVELTEEQIISMYGNASTTLPDGIDRPAGWSDGGSDDPNLYRHWRAAKKEAGLR